MSDNLFRIYQKLNVKDIQENLLIYGDLSASCAKCKKMDIKLDMKNCPECQTEFKFIAFRSIKSHIPKIHKIMEERPDVKILDYDDYQRNLGAQKAKDFLK